MVALSNSLVNSQGWNLQTATGINNFGQIVGTGVFDGETHAYLLTPALTAIPEPSALVLITLGLISLLATRGRIPGKCKAQSTKDKASRNKKDETA